MAFGTKVIFEALNELTSGAITINFNPIGSPFLHPASLITFGNECDVPVYISLDGILDHIRIAADSSFVLDFCSNKVKDDGFFIPKGTILYTRQVMAPPTRGDVWASIVTTNVT